MCGIFFLCHNVLQISMAGDIRQLGLLNTIGATQKQLSRIYHSQIGGSSVPGPQPERRCLLFCWQGSSLQPWAGISGKDRGSGRSAYFPSGDPSAVDPLHGRDCSGGIRRGDQKDSKDVLPGRVSDIQTRPSRAVSGNAGERNPVFIKKKRSRPGKCAIWQEEILPVTGRGSS